MSQDSEENVEEIITESFFILRQLIIGDRMLVFPHYLLLKIMEFFATKID